MRFSTARRALVGPCSGANGASNAPRRSCWGAGGGEHWYSCAVAPMRTRMSLNARVNSIFITFHIRFRRSRDSTAHGTPTTNPCHGGVDSAQVWAPPYHPLAPEHRALQRPRFGRRRRREQSAPRYCGRVSGKTPTSKQQNLCALTLDGHARAHGRTHLAVCGA